jgi:ribosomal protein S18 acetylase RimI-like enzyme
MGKIEGKLRLNLFIFIHIVYLGKQENYHGHVTALSIAPEFRRIGVSSQLMVLLEKVSEQLVFLFLFLFDYYLFE